MCGELGRRGRRKIEMDYSDYYGSGGDVGEEYHDG